MPALDQAERDVPIPALRASDGVWEQEVVDEADPHG
jgi:hypothetical protein